MTTDCIVTTTMPFQTHLKCCPNDIRRARRDFTRDYKNDSSFLRNIPGTQIWENKRLYLHVETPALHSSAEKPTLTVSQQQRTAQQEHIGDMSSSVLVCYVIQVKTVDASPRKYPRVGPTRCSSGREMAFARTYIGERTSTTR